MLFCIDRPEKEGVGLLAHVICHMVVIVVFGSDEELLCFCLFLLNNKRLIKSLRNFLPDMTYRKKLIPEFVK